MHTIAALVLAAGQALVPATEVSGTFDVQVTPAPATPRAADDSRGRMTFTKTFHGALEGTSEGEMLTAGNPATGTAGYVALERFTGTLGGRRGSFVMQHSGTMDGGGQQLAITISPGSGTGELGGIAGSATIAIEDGKHRYVLRYTLPSR